MLGIWGLTWMVGLALGFVRRPHSVGPDGIRAGNGAETDRAIRWGDIHSVETARRVDEPKTARVQTDASGFRTLAVRMQNETNVSIEFERPLELTLPSGAESADVLRIWVDDPRAFVAEVRRHL